MNTINQTIIQEEVLATVLPEGFFTRAGYRRAIRDLVRQGKIDTQESLLKCRPLMLARNWAYVYKLKLVNEAYQFVAEPIRECPMVNDITPEERLVMDGMFTRTVEKFSLSFVKLEVDMNREHQLLLGVWVHDDGTGKPRAFVSGGAGYYQDLVSLEMVDHLPAGTRYYRIDAPSPSSLRRETVIMYDASDMPFALERMDKATTGSWSLHCGQDVTLGDGAKIAQRHSGAWAPSRNWGEVLYYAIHEGKWVGSAIDGMGFMLASKGAEMLSRILGTEVTERAVLGLMIQARPTGVAKCSITFVSKTFMKRLIREHGAVVYGGRDIPDLILDRNALKADFDFTSSFNLEVLDVAKHGIAHTSIQVLQKMVSAGIDRREILEFDRDLYQAGVDHLFDGYKSNSPTPMGFSAYKGKIAASQIISRIAPALVNADKPLFKSAIIEGDMKSMVNDANRVYHEISGGFVRLQADPAILFGHHLLRFGQVFIAGPRGRELSGKQVVIFKYPTVGCGELYLATVVSDDDMLDIIGTSGLDTELRRTLVEYYRSLQNGVMVLPACEEIKKLLAGCDFDWDGALYVEDSKFVALMKRCKPLLVNIDTSNVQKDIRIVGQYGFDLMPKLVLGTIRRGRTGSTVGVITRMNDVVVSLMTAPFAIQKQAIERVFDPVPNRKYVGLSYYQHVVDGTSIDAVDVTPEDVQRIYNEIRHSHLTADVMPKMLKDLNVLFRLLQELTIDSVKTGLVVKVPFNFLRHAECAIHKPMAIEAVYGADGMFVQVKA
jgi:hypothetical protein